MQRIFAIYRKPIFDRLLERIDFLFLFGKNNSGIKNGEADYAESIPSFQYQKRESSVLLFPIFKILKHRPNIVIFEFALGILNLPISIVICKLLNIKTAFWSHGYKRKTGFHPERNIADKYRLFLMKMVDLNIVYSHSDKELLQKYLGKNTVKVVQNTIDTTSLTILKKKLEKEGREQIKKRLGIGHKINLIFIGRMMPSKQPDYLLDVYTELKKNHNITAAIHFIGAGEMLNEIKDQSRKIGAEKDVFFHGTINNYILSGELLFISDLMISKGAMGLNINHSFCLGCPIVSFEGQNGTPNHGPEIEHVEHNRTGFLLKDNNIETVGQTIFNYLQDEAIQQTFRKNIVYKVENNFPMSKMIDDLVECINFLKKGIKNKK